MCYWALASQQKLVSLYDLQSPSAELQPFSSSESEINNRFLLLPRGASGPSGRLRRPPAVLRPRDGPVCCSHGSLCSLYQLIFCQLQRRRRLWDSVSVSISVDVSLSRHLTTPAPSAVKLCESGQESISSLDTSDQVTLTLPDR